MVIKERLKRIASRLPRSFQNELKRLQFAREICRGRFFTDEAEYKRLEEWVSEGDWVVDVGANIGHYTMKLSEIVGTTGRVIAFEPVPATFELLAANASKSPIANITLLNVAASDSAATVGMSIPTFSTGLENFYMAHVSDANSVLQCLTLTIDSLELPSRISLVKIDAEGHELPVLKGMRDLIMRDRPVLIVEDNSRELSEYLAALDYESYVMDGSSNRIFSYSLQNG